MKQEKSSALKRRLQVRFVLLAVLAAAVLLSVIVCVVLLRSYSQIAQKADHLLELIDREPASPELGDAHYFTVTLEPKTHTAQADLSHTGYMQEPLALNLGRQALETGAQRGYLKGYRYAVIRESQSIRVLFLSRKLPLETFRETRKLLILVCLSGLGLTGGALCLVSGRVVAPLVAAHEKQKAFVTSASHALKTPVAVILGDSQLLQMEYGDNEWLCDIEKQAKRLTEMTQSLVTLARWEEGSDQKSFLRFPISDTAEDVAASYQAIAPGRGLDFRLRITPGLSYRGDEKALRELMTVLLDNAFRYCPDGGMVSFALEKKRLGLCMEVRNTAENIRPEELPHFTERFYRGSTAGTLTGSGLGLAIALSITQRHHGKLTVHAPGPREIAVTVVL